MTTPKETFTREEVLQCVRMIWDKAVESKRCGCDAMGMFRIPWKEIREIHEKHMAEDMEDLLDKAVFMVERTFG